MNAVAQVIQFDRRYERLERRALEGELHRWGRWQETKLGHDEGYPGVNILIAYLNGGGGGTPGHRILCLEMPTDVYSIHNRIILKLNEEEREAVWLYYVPRVKRCGLVSTEWTLPAKCLLAGLSEEVVRKRTSRARSKLLGLL
jgi:hypothetical protein